MQPRRLEAAAQRAAAFCAQVTPCATHKRPPPHLLPLFSPRAPAGTAPGTPGGRLAASSGRRGSGDARRCPGKPRQTFPKLAGLGRDLAGGAHAPRPLLAILGARGCRGGVARDPGGGGPATAPWAARAWALSVYPRCWKWLPAPGSPQFC